MHHAHPSDPGSAAPEWVPHPDHTVIARSGLENFERVFGRRPEGIWQSPGRANLNGEHIDFLGGRCLPLALPYGTLVAAAPRTDGLLRMRTLEPSLDEGIVEVRVEDIGPGRPEGWTGYVAGALWGLHEAAECTPGLRIPEGFGADMLIRSTLPVGGGLSSSAALECASILAFVGMITGTDDHDDARRAALAHACMMAEVKVVGASTGGLDQTASLRAHAGHVVSLDCRDFSITYRPADALLHGHRLMGVDTRTPHWLGGHEFTSRRLDAEAAARFLGADRLRDLLPEAPSQDDVDAVLRHWEDAAPTADQLDGRDPADATRRLRHALTEMLRSEQIDGLLSGEDSGPVPEAVGRILTAGHVSMRDDAEASFRAADLIVDTALAAGADGARLIGGGFGGSVLILVPEQLADSVAAAVASAMAEAPLPSPRFLDILPADSGQVVCRDCVELAGLGCS